MDFWKTTEDGRLLCLVCGHRCLLADGQRGLCSVRENRGGRIHCLTAGRLTAIHADPMEKKPLFHFLPGTRVMSVGSWGCNMTCPWCQNWQISQNRPQEEDSKEVTEPWELIEITERQKIPSLAFTYNEPTIALEYILDTFALAKGRGLRTVLVTNGFFSLVACGALAEVTDAMNIDLKLFNGQRYRRTTGGKLELIKHNIEELVSKKVWVELTSLIVPGVNDSQEEWAQATQWLVSVDPSIPWHFNAFHPSFEMGHTPPTDPSLLRRLKHQAQDLGARFVYTGNIPEAESHTDCPHCGKTLITRQDYEVHLSPNFRGVCPACQKEVPGVWE